jgi:formamidase
MNAISPHPKRLNVFTYTRGLLGPSQPMLGPIPSGSTIVTGTPPGCWGPMITPKFQGGHEVTQPVAIEGAEVGDAIAIKIKKMRVTSLATSSGVMSFVDGRYTSDPFVAKLCSNCGAISPESYVEGIGDQAVHCQNCGAEVSAFRFTNGYVIIIDQESGVSVTVSKDVAENIAATARKHSALPEHSEQHSILALARADLPGLISRVQPFLGNIGTTPSIDLPDSHNCADYGIYLVGAQHGYSLTREELDKHKTDGHMDTNSVREGAILICPVKVKGGGVYMGDMHAQQGNGEIAGHATDVSGEVEVEVELIKNLPIDGPILLQRPDDLPLLARPLTDALRKSAEKLAALYGQKSFEDNAPITFIGSGVNLNEATENGLRRAEQITGLGYDEILNRATINGSIEISRLPGTVRVTFLCPREILRKLGIDHLVAAQYGL